VDPNFARELERENTQLRARVGALQSKCERQRLRIVRLEGSTNHAGGLKTVSELELEKLSIRAYVEKLESQLLSRASHLGAIRAALETKPCAS